MAGVSHFRQVIRAVEPIGRRLEALDSEIGSTVAAMTALDPRNPRLTRPLRRLSNFRRELARLREALDEDKRLLTLLDTEARARSKQSRADATQRKYDAHTMAMAKKLGITPAQFVELQEQRRAEMRASNVVEPKVVNP